MIARRAACAAIVLVLVLESSAASGVPPQSDSSTSRTMGTKHSLPGVPNFGEVTPHLYRGGQPTREGFKKLSAMGVGIVVDSGRSRRDEKLLHGLQMQYVSLPWYCPFPRDQIFAQFLKLVRDNPDKKVFVHCRLGDDRTGMMIAAYRMAVQGWSAEEAMKEMKAFGFRISHRFICPGLADYERNFPERLNQSAPLRDAESTSQNPK